MPRKQTSVMTTSMKIGTLFLNQTHSNQRNPITISNLSTSTQLMCLIVVIYRHGTLVAGAIAASKNSVCGVGVAYDASLGGETCGAGTERITDLVLDCRCSIAT